MNRLIIFMLMLGAGRLEAGHLTMALQKALDLKLVNVKALGIGGHSGECIRMEFKNFGKDSLMIMIEAGRRLDSKVERYQDILIVKDQLIVLAPKQTKSTLVKGYCCQSSNASPISNSVYDVGKMADSNLVKVARLISDGEFTQELEQQAVWAISDGHSAAMIASKDDSLASILRIMVAALKGEELPWYIVFNRTHVYSNGMISRNPIALRGTVNFVNEKDCYATLSIYNEKGVQVGFTKSEWVKAAAAQDYQLDIPVRGLEKGKYTLEIKTPGKTLASREFEI